MLAQSIARPQPRLSLAEILDLTAHSRSPARTASAVFKTGLEALDQGLNAPVDALILLGSQIGMGLTATLARIALGRLRDGCSVLWVGNTGNDRQSLALRLLGAEANLLLSQVAPVTKDNDALQARIALARERLGQFALAYLPSTGIDLEVIRRQGTMMASGDKPLGLIVIDLPAGTAPDLMPAVGWQELKALAENLQVPVMVGTRLRCRKKHVRRAWLQDFDVSPHGLQSADIVMALSRQSYFEAAPSQAIAKLGLFVMDVIVVKNRHGTVGSARCILGETGPQA